MFWNIEEIIKSRPFQKSAMVIMASFIWVNLSYGQEKFNPILPDNIADPSVAFFDGTYYLFGTTDIDRGLAQMGPPVVWKSKDFVNWSFDGTILNGVDWSKPYEFVDKEGNSKTGYFRYWAPGRPRKKEGKFYLFPTIVKPDDSMGIYVMVAEHPEGPYEFVNGDGLYFNEPEKANSEAKPLINDIDAEVFIDDDGSAYVYWRRRNAAKLNEDWTGIDGELVKISTNHGGYSEGPTLFKRDGIYYYLYTLSGHANYKNAYMISKDGPLGPFEKPEGPDIFIHSDVETGVWGPGHGNIFKVPEEDKYLFSYLEYGEGGTTRQVFANELEFNPDGTIKPMEVNFEGVGYLGKDKSISSKQLEIAKITASSWKGPKKVEANMDVNPNRLDGLSGPNEKSSTKTFTYGPENAVDNSNYTSWVARETDPKPSLQLDLGKAKKVKKISLAFVHPVFGHAYKLEKSEDGIRWKEVMKQENQKVRTPHWIEGVGKARYLKVTILNGHPGIWEMGVY
ncbi:family 43 glycosylhydrolase [Echinicola jeungdonensis]|uniref:Family 43 glycosylhydrolase n=1 Tax=Echinicola jeungdonensis TaxID=709343 RepID=A0ABV5J500_9BACT|nr:family 43 glycosylhydrolase [Echinicola jeungdonensis]MDN3669534.1 family 43 glycosylhydrolase [Echinicola jeungdonensis]